MIGMIFQRSFHTTRTCLNVTKSSVLGKLRKSTGYPLSNCKKALELFPDDVRKAEEWLHAEAKSKGWTKWAKIQTRTATQGLIGVCSKDNVGVMVEINCETDFVSRNVEFQQLVEKMLSGCVSYAANLKPQAEITKEVLEESQLSSIQCENSSLGELVVAATMKFNEKTVAKRAICLKVPEDVSLNSLTHPAVLCSGLNGASLGKYGVLLVCRRKDIDNATTEDNVDSLRANMCHHIIGMSPLSIGELTEKDIAKFSAKQSADASEESVEENIQREESGEQLQVQPKTEAVVQSEQLNSSEADEEPQQEDESTGLKESSESRLLFQSYLMDPSVTVGETLYKSGVEVVAFERFECGETAEELNVHQDVAVAASA